MDPNFGADLGLLRWSSRGTVVLGLVAGVVAGLGLLAVITAGFALSFSAISSVGRASGISSDLVWLLPTAIDGAMAVGTVTAVVVRRLHRSTVYPWTVVLVNAGISVACNALHAYAGAFLVLPAVVAMAVSAVPAVNLALSVHLLVVLVDALADALTRFAESVPLDSQRDETHVLGDAAGAVDGTVPSLVRQPDVVDRRRVVGAGTGPETLVLRADRGADGTGGEGAEANPSGLQLQRVAWRWVQQNPRPDGQLVSGEELGRTFGRSARWGRYVKRAGRAGCLGA